MMKSCVCMVENFSIAWKNKVFFFDKAFLIAKYSVCTALPHIGQFEFRLWIIIHTIKSMHSSVKKNSVLKMLQFCGFNFVVLKLVST